MSISIKRGAALTLAVVASLMFTGCASSADPAVTSAPASAPTETETATETAPAATEESTEAEVLAAGETFSLGGWDVTVSPFERGQNGAWNAVWAEYDETYQQEMALPEGHETVKYTITVTRTADTPEELGAIDALMVGPNGEEAYTATTDYEEATIQPGETASTWMLEVHPIEVLDAGDFTYTVRNFNTDTFEILETVTVAAQ